MVSARLLLGCLGLIFCSSVQEPPPPALPPLKAYRLGDDQFLVSGSFIDSKALDLIRDLRNLPDISPVAHALPAADRLFPVETLAIDVGHARIESTWLTPAQLRLLASLHFRVNAAVDDLMRSPEPYSIGFAITDSEASFNAAVDRIEESPDLRKRARHSASNWWSRERHIRLLRERDWTQLCDMVAADSIRSRSPKLWRHVPGLAEGFDACLTGRCTGEIVTFILYDSTTPNERGGDRRVENLFLAARIALGRPDRPGLLAVLMSETNALTPEKHAVSAALADYLLQMHRSSLKEFIGILEQELGSGLEALPAERREKALRKAFREGLGIEVEEVETRLKEFATSRYALPEEIAKRIGIDRDVDEKTFAAFVGACEKERKDRGPSPEESKARREVDQRTAEKLKGLALKL